jgi:REP element-mobilizing transposase RayT
MQCHVARPIRIEYANAFYHVTSRGNARARIFLDEYDRDIFLEIIKSAYDRFGFIIHAFVLMDNHYHILIETPHANLSASMKYINGAYTQKFNKRHSTVGHLFQGRYKAFVVDRNTRNTYYTELIRYIHLNPWRAKIIKRLDDFKYSSHSALADKRWAARWKVWYDRKTVLREFGNSEESAISRYREFVNAGKGVDNPLEQAIGGYALGDRDFADWLWEEFIEVDDKRELIGTREIQKSIDPSEIISSISHVLKMKQDDIFKRRRGKTGANLARGLTMYTLYHHTSMTQHQIGQIAGGISRNSVSEAIRQFRRSLECPEIKRIYVQVAKAIKNEL